MMMMTYTRKEIAARFGVSNVMISKYLKKLIEFGFAESGLLDSSNKLTERAIYLIELYREKDTAMLDDELEIEEKVETEAQPTQTAITIASQCTDIAANVGTIEVMSSADYEQRAYAAKQALTQFIEANNARASRLARNAATTRRTFEQLGQEHAIGHLMSYAESMNRTLAEGMAAMQNGAVSMADQMGKIPAENQTESFS